MNELNAEYVRRIRGREAWFCCLRCPSSVRSENVMRTHVRIHRHGTDPDVVTIMVRAMALCEDETFEGWAEAALIAMERGGYRIVPGWPAHNDGSGASEQIVSDTERSDHNDGGGERAE